MITSHLQSLRVSLDISAENLKNNQDSCRERSAYNAIIRALEWVDAELAYRKQKDEKRWEKEASQAEAEAESIA